MREINGYYEPNIKTSRNEDSVYAMKYASQQMLINKLQQENKQLKNNWNKLKEYIKETKLKETEKEFGTRYAKTFTKVEVVYNMITNKMQEMEGK